MPQKCCEKRVIIMNQRISDMRHFFVIEKGQKAYWQEGVDPWLLANKFEAEKTDPVDRSTERLLWMLAHEKPVIFPGEKIAFTRTVTQIPEIFTEKEMEEIQKDHYIHEKGDVFNINADFGKLMHVGLVPKKAELAAKQEELQAAGETEKAHYVGCQIAILDGILDLAERYRLKAVEAGNTVVAETLANVPANKPNSLLEALQMLRILHYVMWCARSYHNTVGRFDQYIYPWFEADMEKGIYTEEEALELIEEFFLSFNRDSDLYIGMQQGDNGQSMVLGGTNPDGSDAYNKLSELCLKASLDLKVIDPKINLRVNKNTPLDTYVLGTELTKQGLGFPQYCNDEVVIPALLRWGYSKEDAHNYVVAACWEFLIPGKSMDITNIEALSFTKALGDAVDSSLETCATYGEFYGKVKENIYAQAEALCNKVKNVYMFPSPYVSMMMDGCEEAVKDISLGGVYNNYGLHGTGVATAADSLAAIKKFVFEEKSVDAAELKAALAANFEGYDLLCNKLRYEAPKMGNNDDYVDQIAVDLLNDYADALEGKKNDRGGVFRAGTGSAMYYIWHAKEVPATPDGRRQGEALGANYSPSLFGRCSGPVSIVQSFAKPDLKRVANGGPLTLELHDTVFRTKESITKVAMLVKSFMDLGGHQLQLNAVNRETMLDAQKHPENYRNLIVRVWGWSGYFVELDKIYQDHIIQRMELVV